MNSRVTQRSQSKPVRNFGAPRRTLLGGIRALFIALLLLLGASFSQAQETLSLTFQLPLERAGHSFTLYQKMGEAGWYGSVTQPLSGGTITHLQDDGAGQTLPTSNSYLELPAELQLSYEGHNLFGYFLFDETAQEMTPVNVAGSETFNRTSFLSTNWFTNYGASNSFFLAIPEARFGHTFSRFADRAAYTVNTGPLLHYATTDAQGNPTTASYGFFDAWSAPGLLGPYFVFDHTAGEKTELLPASNRSLLSATWSSTQGSYPARMLRIWLPDFAIYSTYTLYTSGSGALIPTTSGWYDTEYDANGNVVRAGYQISALIGVNQSFWLVRDEDGYTFPIEWLGEENVSVEYTANRFPSLPRTFSLSVGENYYSGPVYVYQSDGTVVPATPDWDSLNYLATYDGDGNETYRFYYVTFTAAVNGYFTSSGGDASGPRDLMDGYSPPPPPPNWQQISFSVGQNYFGSVVTVDNNGTAIEAWEDTGIERGVSTTWDDYGQEVNFYHATYLAYVDVNQPYTIPDYMDGFQPWHPAPPQGSLAIQLANWRRNHALKLKQADGTLWNVRLQPGYEDETYWCTHSATIFGGTPDERSVTRQIGYAVAIAPFDPAQGFTIIDETAGDSLEFHPQSQASIHLGQWYPSPSPLMLKIPASRWNHALELHTATGETFAIEKGSMQGFWSLDTQGQSWFHSYYYLDASTQMRQGVDWWVYDKDVQDSSDVNEAELSAWAAPEVDADTDNLPDWWEELWGFDPSDGDDASLDTDNDGLSDWWERRWGLNPNNRDEDGNGVDDSADDFDGDDISNGDEAQSGDSDPGRPPAGTPSLPKAPTALDLVPRLGENQLVLTWESQSTNEARFAIEALKYVVETLGSAPVLRWTKIGETTEGITRFVVPEAAVFSRRFRVYAFNSAGRSTTTREFSMGSVAIEVLGYSGEPDGGPTEATASFTIDQASKNNVEMPLTSLYEDDPDGAGPLTGRFISNQFEGSMSVIREAGKTYPFKWKVDVKDFTKGSVDVVVHGGSVSETRVPPWPESPYKEGGTYSYEGEGTVTVPDTVLRIYQPSYFGSHGAELTESASDGTFYYPLRLNTDRDDNLANGTVDSSDIAVGEMDDDLTKVELSFAPSGFTEGTVTVRVPPGIKLFTADGTHVPVNEGKVIMDCEDSDDNPLKPLLYAKPSSPLVLYMEGTSNAQAGTLALEYKKKPTSQLPNPGTWLRAEVVLLPIEIAPEIVKMNGNFDEGRIDPYALRDCDDEDLKADRDSYHDTFIKSGKIVTKDLHKNFFGARPDTLSEGWETGATITIEKLPEIDPDTDRPETGEIRLHAIKDLGQSGEQSWAIQLTEGSPENPTPKNLVPQLYGPSASIPKGEGVDYWMEGIKSGKITLEFKYTKGSLTFTHKQKFKVVTEQSKAAWQQEARNEILLETQGQTDINDYEVAGGPFLDPLHAKYFAMNKDNILAVYKHYEKIYMAGPEEYLWAGLAKLAGAPVYAGLSDAQWGRLGEYVMPPLMVGVSGAVLKDIQTILVKANIDIYQDLAWQFAAYRASGIDALRYVDGQDPTSLNFLAWRDIDDGIAERDSSKISAGNVELLRREQQIILADTYNDLDALGFGLVSWMFSILAENPVPGGPSFSSAVPAGNIADFSDRWTWITAPNNGMWKLWTDASVNTRKGWVETPLRTRADEYNLVPVAPVW